jgi:hypothetical protein
VKQVQWRTTLTNTGGWLGKFRVTKATEIRIAILNMGEAVGLGKGCVFGFGQFEQSEGVNSQEEAAAMA